MSNIATRSEQETMPGRTNWSIDEDVVALYFTCMGLSYLAVSELIRLKCGRRIERDSVKGRVGHLRLQYDLYNFETRTYYPTKVGAYLSERIENTGRFRELTYWGPDEDEVVQQVNQQSTLHMYLELILTLVGPREVRTIPTKL